MTEDHLDDRPIAAMRLGGATTAEPMFRSAPQRRSVKEPFDTTRAVAPAALAALREVVVAAIGPASTVGVDGSVDPEHAAWLRALTWDAHRIEVTTPRTNQESVDLMRIGRREIEASPDGIDLGGRFMEAMAMTGMISRSTLADPQSTAFRQGLDMYRELHAATPAHIWLTTRVNDRHGQFAAGRNWLRLNLAATAAGLSLHPVSQALQEYPEMAALRAQLHERLAPTGATVQMLGRLGYSAPIPPSPRWPLASALQT